MLILAPIAKAAGKAIISLLMSLATEAFMKEILIMLAEMAAKSTKTTLDDKLVEKVKEALGEE
jgi:hypothetical protein